MKHASADTKTGREHLSSRPVRLCGVWRSVRDSNSRGAKDPLQV